MTTTNNNFKISGNLEFGNGTIQTSTAVTFNQSLNSNNSVTFTAVTVSTTATAVTVRASTTASVDLLSISKNNNDRVSPGQSNFANTMLVANNNTSGGIVFGTRNASNQNRNTLLTRNGGFVFHDGASIATTVAGGLQLATVTTSSTALITLNGGQGQGFVSVNFNGVNIQTNDGSNFYNWYFSTSSGVTTMPGEIVLANANAHGGTGYAGMITMTNNGGGTNINKYVRLNSTGDLQIVDSAYANIIFEVTDAGKASAPILQATSMMRMPVYTAAALTAITGAVGWMACVSDSSGGGHPNGMMAFWDTTHGRWSYVHDNSSV